jgi:hypothetical protein
MSKRVSLGRHALDGAYGLRVAPQGHSVDDPNAPLLFDTNRQQLQPLFVMPYETTVQTTHAATPNMPRGYEEWGGGGTMTYSVKTFATVSFPYALPFVPLVLMTYNASFNGGTEIFRGSHSMVELGRLVVDVTSSSVSSELTITLLALSSVDYTPTHTAYVYGVPYA